MPFCPKCRYEYKRHVTVCPDCEERLVEALPEDPDDQPWHDHKTVYRDWVKLARLSAQQYAELVLEGLRAKGIPCVILSTAGHFGQLGMMGISAPVPIEGGYFVTVPREFADDADKEARLILGDVWDGSRIADGK